MVCAHGANDERAAAAACLIFRKSFRAAGAHSNRKQRWNHCFHKKSGHVPDFLYKPLSSVPVRRAQTAEYSFETVVSNERLFENIVFRTVSGSGRRFPAAAASVPADGRPYRMIWPTLTAALCIACSALFAACCALRRMEGFIIAPAATMETTAPATAPAATPEIKGDTCMFSAAFLPVAVWVGCCGHSMSGSRRDLHCTAASKIPRKNKFILHVRLFTNPAAYDIINKTIRL